MNRVPVLALAALASVVTTAPARAARCPGQAPVLVIAQDWSGSMVGTIDGSNNEAAPRKWTAVQTSLPDVLNQYDADFQYALMMYPLEAGGCTYPTTPQLSVDANASSIAGALDVVPAGRTPTAQTLQQAKAYIDGLNLPSNVPAHVVLVTDGLPNCNPNLDPLTCYCDDLRTGAGTSGGAASFCYTNNDPNRCLDDDRTIAAAAALNAAGHRVYVVGFGAFVNQGNNAQVLNELALAGGTTQSYNATDPAGFVTALNTVVTAARDCCLDACSLGQSSCTPSGNAETECVLGAEGCNIWQTTTCPNGNLCTGGQCQTCTNTCTAGQRRCGLLGPEVCATGSNGCTDWQFDQFCPSGTTCQAGNCTSCTTTCTAGATQCQGDGSSRTCTADIQGCTSWGPIQDCAPGTLCNASTGACASCTTTCVAGARQCVDSAMSRECVADSRGCTSWTPEACGAGETCNGGTCAGCNACTAGERRCVGNVVQSCISDGQGCTAWSDVQECTGGQLCQAGACNSCPTSCTPGASQCQGDSVVSCVTGPNGCNDWAVVTTCAEPQACSGGACCTNFCTAGSQRCAADGASVETCAIGAGGCTAWNPGTACASGQACHNGDCLQRCEDNFEGSTCPAGFECTATLDGTFCVPVGGSSSSSSGGASSGTASGGVGSSSGGTGNGVGGGNGEEEDVTTTGCGCAVDQGRPESMLLLALGMLVLYRRRRA